MGKTQSPLITAREMQEEMGFSRSMAYQLLSRNDLPVVNVGGRKFLHRELFARWLEKQATDHQASDVKGA